MTRRAWGWLALPAMIVVTLAWPAGSHAADAALTDTSAFEYAEGLSFYAFDGCGDALAGRMMRRALSDKFAHCPFTPAARARFAERARAQQAKSRTTLAGMVDERGGLPMQMPGMTKTCHEQTASPAYQRFRDTLERYDSNAAAVDTVLPASCDAASLMP